jgi:hypothetical protein
LNLIKAEVEYQILINMHTRALKIITTPPQIIAEHQIAQKERVKDYEQQLHIIRDNLADFDDLIASYHCYYPPNKKVEEILKDIDNTLAYPKDLLSKYDQISDYQLLLKEQEKDIGSKGHLVKDNLLKKLKPLLDAINADR